MARKEPALQFKTTDMGNAERLMRLKPNLKATGITFDIDRNHKGRFIMVRLDPSCDGSVRSPSAVPLPHLLETSDFEEQADWSSVEHDFIAYDQDSDDDRDWDAGGAAGGDDDEWEIA
jgi:hypothetical protein